MTVFRQKISCHVYLLNNNYLCNFKIGLYFFMTLFYQLVILPARRTHFFKRRKHFFKQHHIPAGNFSGSS
jgi:hypothetical protein